MILARSSEIKRKPTKKTLVKKRSSSKIRMNSNKRLWKRKKKHCWPRSINLSTQSETSFTILFLSAIMKMIMQLLELGEIYHKLRSLRNEEVLIIIKY